MKFLDYAILALVVIVIGLAVWRMIKRRKSGSCCGCSGGCEHCAARGNCEENRNLK